MSDNLKFTRPKGWQSFYGNGKLLLSGEYYVLDGAVALALPTRLGQLLHFHETADDLLYWKSYDEKDHLWFAAFFSLENLKIIQTNNFSIAQRLSQILQTARALNPDFLQKGFEVETKLTFPRDWGLGTSSTLIYMIAKWAKVDAFVLLEKTFGGSGYDIACAGAKRSILYKKQSGKPHWEHCNFNPLFSHQLFFIYLGKKQNSREGISHYRAMRKSASLCLEFTLISKKMLECDSLEYFELLINGHENIISKTLNLPKVKDLYFNDYWGAIKSLGAWGGDFVLATSNRSEKETRAYFNKKGFEVFLKYEELILNGPLDEK